MRVSRAVTGSARRGVVLLAAAVLLLVPAPAHAAGTPTQDPPPQPFTVDGGNWSGYVMTGTGFRSVSARWTQPVVTCTAGSTAFAPWVGLDGYGSGTVQQTGVATDCSGGTPVSRAWYEVAPEPAVYYEPPVQGGDEIAAEVVRSGDSYTMTIRNLTQGWSRSAVRTHPGANVSAEVALEAQQGGFPEFGSVRFTGATVDGKPMSTPSATAIDATDAKGFLTSTGGLSGGAFTIRHLRE
ncbi:Peptidase A4 family protein [Pseudonocardia ammonioxydans]|uniref:Peptidase A4 family protein n=1 Tax=Pseudonocardia ammonioxydans TaxID=260086 RepID=A0A1I5ATP4_PSUAM|nr:G1 family glutamic endopeptidase [Pseudonocardia ammonioxydans]SFN65795.1 Peptidase A4 family protein [Pseudonocardia ammonioxydans]